MELHSITHKAVNSGLVNTVTKVTGTPSHSAGRQNSPANPSGTDKRVAAQANAKESQAREELLKVQQEELLQGKPTANILSENQETSRNSESELTASTYSSLKTKLAVYEKMAAN